MSYVRALVCLAMVVTVMPSARAADVAVSGHTARLRDFDVVARRSSRVRLVDTAIDLSGVDPTATGATAEFFSPTTAQLLTLTLPAEGWRASRAAVRRFRFRSRALPRLRVSLDDGRLVKFQMRGAQAYALGQPQVAVVVRLTIGPTRFCAVFGGKVARDDPKRFVASDAPRPVSCPLAPGEGSTTTSTEPISTTTSTASSTTTTTEIPSTTTTTEIETTTTTTPTTTTTDTTTTTTTSTTTTTDTTTTTLVACETQDDCDDAYKCRDGVCVPCQVDVGYAEACDPTGLPCCFYMECIELPSVCVGGAQFCCID